MHDIIRTISSKNIRTLFYSKSWYKLTGDIDCLKLIESYPTLYFIIGLKYASNVKILPNSKCYQENDIACMGWAHNILHATMWLTFGS